MAALLGPVSEDNVFYLGSLDGKQNRILFHGSSPITYANGYLLYLAQNVLMARPFNPEKMEAGAPVPLFQTRLRKPVSAMEVVSYAVTGDGQRFLVNTRIDEPSAAPLSIILNWASEIER